MAILLALMFWGMVWGVVGMFLAVPITVVIHIVLGRLELTAPVARLLSGQSSEDESGADAP